MSEPTPFSAVVVVEGAKRAAASPRKLAVLRAVVAGELCKSAGDTGRCTELLSTCRQPRAMTHCAAPVARYEQRPWRLRLLFHASRWRQAMREGTQAAQQLKQGLKVSCSNNAVDLTRGPIRLRYALPATDYVRLRALFADLNPTKQQLASAFSRSWPQFLTWDVTRPASISRSACRGRTRCVRVPCATCGCSGLHAAMLTHEPCCLRRSCVLVPCLSLAVRDR
jgi:hypothetical protein